MQLVYNKYTVRDRPLPGKQPSGDLWYLSQLPTNFTTKGTIMSQSEFFCWMHAYGQEVAADMARAEGIGEFLIYEWVCRNVGAYDMSEQELSETIAEFSYAC